MKKLPVRLLIAAALAAGVSSVAFADDTPSQCSVKTLRGRYLVSASGFTFDAGGVARPKALIEIIEFDGNGSVLVPAGTRSVNGVIARFVPTPGFVYTLGDDCAGTMTFDGPTFDIAVAQSGSQFRMIQTNPGNVFEGSGTRTAQGTAERDQR